MKSFYRDHFFHALQVCFLGHMLLEQHVRLEGSPIAIWRLVADRLGLDVNDASDAERRVLQLWYLTALLHDVGYGIEIYQGVLGLLTFFGRATEMGEFLAALRQAAHQLSAALDGFEGYSQADRPGLDHGVVAARHLEALVARAVPSDSGPDRALYAHAVRAIAVHNSRKHSVSFARDPLGFLLVLCDTVQEWNRMRFGPSTGPAEMLARLAGPEGGRTLVDGPVELVGLELEHATDRVGAVPSAITQNLRCRVEYGSAIQKDSGVFNLWVDATCNLQRLCFDGLPDDLDITVEFVTPLHRASDGTAQEQLHRLRNAAYETHMMFLYRWFPDGERAGGWATNGAVEQRVEVNARTGAKQEHLALHLRVLADQRPLASDVGEFRRALTRWKHYHDDRDFGGDYAIPEMPG